MPRADGLNAAVEGLLRLFGDRTRRVSGGAPRADTSGHAGAPDRAVVLAVANFEGHQLYDQKLARALARAGSEVVYVEPAVPVVRAARHGAARAMRRVSEEGIVVITPRMMPFGQRRPLATLTTLLSGVQIRLLMAGAAAPDLAPDTGSGPGRRRPGRVGGGHRSSTEVFVCGAHPVLVRFFRRWPRVIIVLDDYPAGAGLIGVDPEKLRRHRRSLLRFSPAAAAVSPYLRDILLRDGVLATVVPPGTEPVDPHLPEPAALRGVPHPRAAFIGMMSDRIDFDLLAAVVGAGATLVLAGRSQATFSKSSQLAELLAGGAAVHLGELDPAELDAALTHCDVGLVPYTLSDFNLASFPLKILEYLAAGLPVLSSDLPAARWLDRPEVFVAAAGTDPAPAIGAVIAAAAEPGIRERCRATAAANEWGERIEVLSSLARQGPTRPAAAGPLIDRLGRMDPADVAVHAAVRAFATNGPVPEVPPDDAWVLRARDTGVLAPMLHVAQRGGWLPPEDMTLLRRERTLRHLRMDSDLAHVSSVLDAAGVSHAVLKGPALASVVFAEGQARDYADLDLLVAPRQLGCAVQALADSGCTLMPADWPLALRYDTAELALTLPFGTVLDLHWNLVNHGRARPAFGLDTELLLSRRVHRRVADTTLTTLDDLDLTLHVMLHACLSGCVQLRWLLDVQQCLLWLDGRQEALVARAHESNLALPARVVLDAVAAFVDPTAARWAEAMRPPSSWSRAMARVLGQLPPSAPSVSQRSALNWLTCTRSDDVESWRALTQESSSYVRHRLHGGWSTPAVRDVGFDDPEFRTWLARSAKR